MPSNNANLARAAAVRDDEFYTRHDDIEREMDTYPPGLFKGATVVCPCDDPARSQFYRYFRHRFHHLGLYRLWASGLSVADRSPVGRIYDGVRETGLALKSGSFASPHIQQLFNDATIVVTNPPFSMIRLFVASLARSGARFCIMGPLHTVSYRSVLPMVLRGEMWMGGTKPRAFTFDRPDGSEQKLGNVCWFTNMTHTRRNRIFPLTRSYDPDLYPNYTNADGINVDRGADIPADFAGTMGVPVSFLEKLNPRQFEIVGFKRTPTIAAPDGSRRNVFNRLLIRNRAPAGFVTVSGGGGSLLW